MRIIVAVTIAIIVLLLLASVSSDSSMALSLSPDDVSEQLEVDLPNPILRESAGAVDSFESGDSLVVAWLAKSQAFIDYPPPDTTGNLVYVSTYNISTGATKTTCVPLGKYTIKDALRVAASPLGGVHLFWLEDSTLWDCRFLDGRVLDLTRTFDANVSDFDIVVRHDTIDVYALSPGSTSIRWSRRGGSPAGPGALQGPAWTIEGVAATPMGLLDLVLVHGSNATSDGGLVGYLLADDGSLLRSEALSNGSGGPVALATAGGGGTVHVVALVTGTGMCTVWDLSPVGQTVSVAGPHAGLGLYRTGSIRAVLEDGVIQVYSINVVEYPGIRKLQRYSIDLVTYDVAGPVNVTPFEDSSWDNTFSVLVAQGDSWITLSELYYGGISKGYSKMVLLRRDSDAFEPLALLNARSDQSPSVGDIDTLTDDEGRHWVTVTVSTNGSLEIAIFRAMAPGFGNLTWVASTPWWSTISRSNCKPLYADGKLLLVHQALPFMANDPNICVIAMDIDTHEISNQVLLVEDLTLYYGITSWDSYFSAPDRVVVATLSMRQLVEISAFMVGTWTHEPLAAVETSLRVHTFALGETDDSLLLFTLEERSDETKGIVRELRDTGHGLDVSNTWTFLDGEFENVPDLLVEDVGAHEYVLLVRTDHLNIEDTEQFWIFNASDRSISGPFDLGLPKTYRVYAEAVAPFSDDSFAVALWGLDVDRLATEALRVLELNLFVIDRSDPRDASGAIPFAITGLGQDSIDIGPGLALLAEAPLRCALPFVLYGVGSETTRLFCIGYDFLSPALAPKTPLDGSLTNNTLVGFSATPVGDVWEAQTYYQVRVWDVTTPDEPFLVSSWSTYPAHELVLPSGKYRWKYVYKRFSSFVESDWTWTFTVDTLPPTADAGGPYLEATVGVPLLLNADASTDDNGLAIFRWTFWQDPVLIRETDMPSMMYTPVRIGTVLVTLEVMDTAGNWARTSTVVFARPPAPELGVLVPPVVLEGREVDLTCTVANSWPGMKYNYLWKQGSRGGASSTFTISFPDDGAYPVSVDVWDSYGQNASWEGTVEVVNLPPGIGPLPDVTVDEYEPLTVQIDVTDVPADAIEYRWELDGALASTTDSLTVRLGHGEHVVSVSVEDDDGGTNSTTFHITALPWISTVYARCSVNASLGELTVTWDHGEEEDFGSVVVTVSADVGGADVLANFTTTDPGVRSHAFPKTGFPEVVYVIVTLQDDSLESHSDVVEVAVPREPSPPVYQEDWTSDAFWIVLLLLLVSVGVSIYMFLRVKGKK